MTDQLLLWIDDERVVPEGFSHWAKSSQDAIDVLTYWKSHGMSPELISFDHDLGYNYEYGHSSLDGGKRDDNTRRVMDWMRENDFWPNIVQIHSANPVGVNYLAGFARSYAPQGTRVVVGTYAP